MAAGSAKRLRERIRGMETAQAHAVMFTLRGVSATNKNDLLEAKRDFLEAYSLDPASAFSLNNRGYVAEMDGDLETAQFFYEKARRAGDSNARVGLSSLQTAEGKSLFTVAEDSDQQVDGELDKYSQGRRKQTGPIELSPRIDAQGGVSSVLPANSPPLDVPPTVVSSLPPPVH